MGYMITMISMPVRLFHRDWMAEFAQPFTKAMAKQLLGASDKLMKDVTPGDVAQIQISMQSINGRVMLKEAAKMEAELLKLQITKKGLGSELLERRINGIKELNLVIKSTVASYGSAKVFSLDWLINWMTENGVFDILWDNKKTHL